MPRYLMGLPTAHHSASRPASPGAGLCLLFLLALTAPLSACHLLFSFEPGPADATPDGNGATDANHGTLTLLGPATVAGGSCSSAYAITRQGGDHTSARTSDSTIVLLSGGGRGQFYRDADCTIVIDSVLLASDTSSSEYFFKAPLAEQLMFTAEDDASHFAAASLPVTVTATLLRVEPLYPTHGPAWNSYVKDDGPDPWSAQDQPCGDADEGGACLHGGELKRVLLAGVADCQSLELGDTLAAFHWTCRPVDAYGVELNSTGLRADKGLADLISEDAWRPNRLELRLGGELVAASEEALWWDNPVVPLPDNRASDRIVLDEVDDDGAGPDESFAPGTVFTLAADQETGGYNIDLDQASLVTLASATLTYAGGSKANCHEMLAEATGNYDSKICLLAAGDQKFLWIEGSYDGKKPLEPGVHYLFNLSNVSFSTLRHLRGRHSASNGLVLRKAARNRLTEVTIENTGYRGVILNEAEDNLITGLRSLWAGEMGLSLGGGEEGSKRNVLREVLIEGAVEQSLYFDKGSDNLFHGLTSVGGQHDLTSLTIYAHGNRFVDVSSHHNAGHGLLVGGDGNVFVNLSLTNNGRDGLHVSCSWRGPVDNTFVGVVAANNGGSGVRLSNPPEYNTQRHIVSHVTAVNNDGDGITINGADYNLLHQVVTANNGGAGLAIGTNGPAHNTVHDLASAHNASANVRLYNASNSHFRGQLILGGAPVDCDVSGGTLPGLLDRSCSLAGTSGSSDYGEQLSDAVLEIEADLAKAFLGQVLSDDPVNRSDTSGARSSLDIDDWSSFSSPYRFWGPEGDAFLSPDNRGPCLAGTCRIWDVRLSGQPSPILFRHGAFVGAADCPVAASGDDVVRDGQIPSNSYLAHATEVLFDGLGDDDGLCASQEACVYSPHLGAFQGDEELTDQSCSFADGLIQGVELKAFSASSH